MRKLTFKLLLASLFALTSTNAFSQLWYETFDTEIPEDWTIHQENSIDFLYWYDEQVVFFRQSPTFDDLLLVSPAIEIDPEGYINFDLGAASSAAPEMAFGTVTDPNDPSTFTELALYIPTEDWVTNEFDLTNLSDPDNIVYFAWKMISDEHNYFSMTNVLATGSILGVNELQDVKLNIFPNPSKGNININSPVDLGETTLTIFDINGRKVFYQEINIHNTVNINTASLNTGLYILNIESENYLSTEKFLVD